MPVYFGHRIYATNVKCAATPLQVSCWLLAPSRRFWLMDFAHLPPLCRYFRIVPLHRYTATSFMTPSQGTSARVNQLSNVPLHRYKPLHDSQPGKLKACGSTLQMC